MRLPSRRLTSVALFRELGPGLVTGAADDDPSGIATYSQAGAQFGFGLLWTMVLTYPLMVAIQLISAHVGRVTGRGLARTMLDVIPRPAVTAIVALLFIANTINIGADISAMGAAARLVAGRGEHLFTVAFALLALGLQLYVPYARYANILKVLTLTLLSYVALLFFLPVDWHAVMAGLVWPRSLPPQSIVTVVAVFGTTISPYLFFWQAAQEVEGAAQAGEPPLLAAPHDAPAERGRMRWDTFFGMAVSNVVALAIMIVTAATLHEHGKTGIATAADAAQALQPIAGRFAFALFSLGIIGTGLLAVPVLAGSAGFAVAEALGWKTGLEHKPRDAAGFYGVIALATLLGIAIDWSPLDPIRALFYSAVINGVVAVPIMAATMVVSSRPAQMGQFRNGPALLFFGWTATAVMAFAAVAMLVWH